MLQHGPLSRMESSAFPSVTAHDRFNDCCRMFGSKVLLVIYDVGFHLVSILEKATKTVVIWFSVFKTLKCSFIHQVFLAPWFFLLMYLYKYMIIIKCIAQALKTMLIIGWKRTLSLQQFKFTIAVNALHHHSACSCSWKPQYSTVILNILKHFSTSSI